MVRIKGTKGIGGWERGKLEGDLAAFRGPSETEGTVKVKLQARLPKIMDIPAHLLIPVKPFKKIVGGNAIVIFGELIGSEVEVTRAGDDDWMILDTTSGTRLLYPSCYLAAPPIILH